MASRLNARTALALFPISGISAQFEELEPRILYSADVAAALGPDTGPTAGGLVHQQQLINTAVVQSVQTSSLELVFLDLAAPDAESLLAGLQSQRDQGRNLQIHTIRADEDGITAISKVLAQQLDVSAVHLVGHGSEGRVELGQTALDQRSLLQRAAEVAAWGHALQAHGDLLIYGCDVAAGDTGQQLLAALAGLTGLDVAASEDATGSAALGGNWKLEVQTGVVETAELMDAGFQASWNSLLSNDVAVNNTNNSTPQDTAAEHRGSQQAVTMDDAGNYVVVWASQGQDGAGAGVYARRFALDGTPLTAEIQVNTTTAGDQNQARVVSDGSGRFAVAWTSDTDSGRSVMLRLFNADGSQHSNEILVNTTTSGNQLNPTLSINQSDGSIVVVWEGQGVGDSSGVFFRRFSSSGTAIDTLERRANINSDGDERSPAVAMDSSGRFVVAYEANDHMYFQRFTATGDANGSLTQVDGEESNSSGVAIAMDAAGNFALAYRENGDFLPGIWGRSYMADGSPRTGWFYAGGGDANNSSIAMDAAGDFVVTYSRTVSSNTNIYAIKYQANGIPKGLPFVVNQHTAGVQTNPSVALLSLTDFVVAWSGVTAADTSGVAARSFEGAAPVITSDGGGASAAINVAENTTAVTTVVATDADAGATLSYSIVGGSDAARFTIQSGSGALSFSSAPYFDAPTDTGANNVYEVEVQASDGFRQDRQTISVTVTPVNDHAPAFTSLGGGATASVTVQENSSTVATLQATDADVPAPALSYRVSGGSDGSFFSLQAGTGQLVFASAPDFENPLDNNADNVYEVQVEVSDGSRVDTQTIAVTVADVGSVLVVDTLNDIVDGITTSTEALMANKGADGFVSLREALTASNNTPGVQTLLLGAGTHLITRTGPGEDLNSTDDLDVRDSVIITGAGADVTTISGGGAFKLIEFKQGSSQVSKLTLADGGSTANGAGLEVDAGATLVLSQAVVRNNVASAAYAGGIENAGSLSLIDVEVRDNSAGLDGGGLRHIGTELHLERVTFAGNSAGNEGGAVYINGTSVTVLNTTFSANTAGSNGGALYSAVPITITNATFADNTAAVNGGGAIASSSTISVRNSLFTPSTGGAFGGSGSLVSLGNNLATDALAALDQTSDRVSAEAALDPLASNGGAARTHALRVESEAINAGANAGAPPTDQRGYARVGTVDIGAYEYSSVSNLPPVNSLPTSLAAWEDQTLLITSISVADPNQTDSINSWRLASSRLEVTQGALTVTLAGSTVITNGANSSAGFTLQGSEAEINATLASLRYLPLPHDHGSETLTVTSMDGAGLSRQNSVGIHVASVNDAPSGRSASLLLDSNLRVQLTRTSFGFSDNAAAAETNAFASVWVHLPTAGTLLLNGTPLAAATEVAVMQLAANALVYQADAAASGSAYASLPFQVRDDGGTDGGGTDLDTSVAYLSMDVPNRAPAFTAPSANATTTLVHTENVWTLVTLTAHDPDTADPRIYSIAGGADAALFNIDAQTGSIVFIAAPDFENPHDADGDRLFELVVAVSDGQLHDLLGLQIRLTDANEFPVGSLIDLDAGVNEYLDTAAVGSTVGVTAHAQDADGSNHTVTYSLVDNASGRFNIDSGSGVVSLAQAPGELGDVVFSITVRADSADGSASQAAFAVNARPVNNHTPVFVSNGGLPSVVLTQSELQTTAASLRATDADLPAQPLQYSIVGGPDAALFVLDGSSGLLSWRIAPDYESASDADVNNTYQLLVQAGDGALTTTQELKIQVLNVDEAPVWIINRLVITEGGVAVPSVMAVDTDSLPSALQYTWRGLAGGRFELTAAPGTAVSVFTQGELDAGAVRFVADGGEDAPAYELVLTDGNNLLAPHRATVVFTPENDAPQFTHPSGGTPDPWQVPENNQAVAVLQARDVDTDVRTLRFAIAGGADAALFAVDATTGALRFLTAPDYEAPHDADRNGRYELMLSVTDGQATVSQAVGVIVVDVNEAPVVQNPSLPDTGATATAATAATDLVVTRDVPEPRTQAQARAPAQPAKEPEVVAATPAPGKTPNVDALQEVQPLLEAPATTQGAVAAPSNASQVRLSVAPVAPEGKVESAAAGVQNVQPAATANYWSQSLAALEWAADGSAQQRLQLGGSEWLLGRNGSALAQAMDAMRQDDGAADGQAQLQMDVASAALVSSGLSVSYVLWLARGGVLLASLMSSVPAWASVDPLPVLAQARRRSGSADGPTDGEADAEDSEFDPVDRLFNRARDLLRSPSTPPPGTDDARNKQGSPEELSS